MLTKVKNLVGTAGRTPDGYTSWADYWCAKTGRPWPNYCSACGCTKRAAVGAHVIKVGSGDRRCFIVPLCFEHNNDPDATFLVEESSLIPENDRR